MGATGVEQGDEADGEDEPNGAAHVIAEDAGFYFIGVWLLKQRPFGEKAGVWRR